MVDNPSWLIHETIVLRACFLLHVHCPWAEQSSGIVGLQLDKE